MLAVGSGMRISELIGLKLSQVANKDGKPLSNILLEKHSTKSKRSRRCYVSKQAQKHLQDYLATLPSQIVRNAPLFPSQKGGHMTANSGVRLVDTLFKLAGINNATSHSLRKTHANTLRRNGCDLLIIQQQLGHSSLAITQRLSEHHASGNGACHRLPSILRFSWA